MNPRDRRPLPHRNPFERYDLRTQGLSKTQINHMTTVRLVGTYL